MHVLWESLGTGDIHAFDMDFMAQSQRPFYV